MNPPLFSIVIPTYNRLDKLKLLLLQLEAQTYPIDKFETVIVSDGSSDGTWEYLTNYSSNLKIKAIFQQNSGPAVARNQGVELAQGRYILFLDDDVIPSPGLIEQHLDFHAHYGDRLVVIGPMVSPPDYKMSPWVAWEQIALTKQYDDMLEGKYKPTARQFYTGNASLERSIFIEYGGFNPEFRRAEDVEFAFRLEKADITFMFNPDAIGYHYANRSLQSWLETPKIYGKNDVIFTTKLDNEWLLPRTFLEFEKRNPLSRLLVYLCLGRPALEKLGKKFLLTIGEYSYTIGLRRIAFMAYSGVFNLEYYKGISGELGGRANFIEAIR